MDLLAHGVGNTGDSAGEFLRAGFLHMAGGWDHLLFIAGVLLLAKDFERGIKLLSLFALGHSITLVAATPAGWRVSAVAVDVVIALSLVFVGVVGWLGLLIDEMTRPKWRPRTTWRLAHGILVVLGLIAAGTLVAEALPAAASAHTSGPS